MGCLKPFGGCITHMGKGPGKVEVNAMSTIILLFAEIVRVVV